MAHKHVVRVLRTLCEEAKVRDTGVCDGLHSPHTDDVSHGEEPFDEDLVAPVADVKVAHRQDGSDRLRTFTPIEEVATVRFQHLRGGRELASSEAAAAAASRQALLNVRDEGSHETAGGILLRRPS